MQRDEGQREIVKAEDCDRHARERGRRPMCPSWLQKPSSRVANASAMFMYAGCPHFRILSQHTKFTLR